MIALSLTPGDLCELGPGNEHIRVSSGTVAYWQDEAEGVTSTEAVIDPALPTLVVGLRHANVVLGDKPAVEKKVLAKRKRDRASAAKRRAEKAEPVKKAAVKKPKKAAPKKRKKGSK